MALLENPKGSDDNILAFTIFKFAFGEDNKTILKKARFWSWMKDGGVDALNNGFDSGRKSVVLENLLIPVRTGYNQREEVGPFSALSVEQGVFKKDNSGFIGAGQRGVIVDEIINQSLARQF